MLKKGSTKRRDHDGNDKQVSTCSSRASSWSKFSRRCDRMLSLSACSAHAHPVLRLLSLSSADVTAWGWDLHATTEHICRDEASSIHSSWYLWQVVGVAVLLQVVALSAVPPDALVRVDDHEGDAACDIRSFVSTIVPRQKAEPIHTVHQ